MLRELGQPSGEQKKELGQLFTYQRDRTLVYVRNRMGWEFNSKSILSFPSRK